MLTIFSTYVDRSIPTDSEMRLDFTNFASEPVLEQSVDGRYGTNSATCSEHPSLTWQVRLFRKLSIIGRYIDGN